MKTLDADSRRTEMDIIDVNIWNVTNTLGSKCEICTSMCHDHVEGSDLVLLVTKKMSIILVLSVKWCIMIGDKGITEDS